MKITLFGATGRTGRQILSQALAEGHLVTAVGRSPRAVFEPHPQMQIAVAAFDDQVAVRAAMHGCDAVLSAVGAPLSRAVTSVHEDSARAILRVMQAETIRRLVVVSSGGTNPQHDPNLPFVFEQVFKRLFINIYHDQIRMEQHIMASDRDWTIIRPPQLTDDVLDTRYRTAEAYAIAGGNSVSRADVAHLMLRVLDDPSAYRKAYAIAR